MENTNNNILEIKNLHTYFYTDSGVIKSVDGVDIELREGSTLGIVGESGSGKSVTALSVMGLLMGTTGKVAEGEILCEGRDLTKLDDEERRKMRGEKISMIFQDPMTSLNPVMKIGDQITECILMHNNISKQEAWDKAVEMLKLTGVPRVERMMKEYPFQLSGGQRQRVMIAMALVCKPKILIADEPTTALDVTIQAQILDLMENLKQKTGTSILFITHDLGLAAERAQHIVVMYKGQVVESGPSLEVLQHPQHPYTKRLVAAAPSLASQRIVSVEEHGQDASSIMEHKVNEQSLETADTIIEVSHLTREFKLPRTKDMFKAVDDVSFKVKRGTTLAIVGESGSGKSTVANMVLKLLEPTSGTVTYNGSDIAQFKGKSLLDFRRHVQPVFQNPYGSLDPMYSIFRSIEEPLRIHKIGDKKSRAARVRELLDLVELPESVMRRYPNELSGGQRQRIAIARAMALNPDVIVCDEAVSALDVLVQDQVLHLLNDLQAKNGLSYLFITHDLAVVRQIADDVVVMQHGKLVEHGTTDEVFLHPQQQYTRDLLDAIPGGKLELGLNLD